MNEYVITITIQADDEDEAHEFAAGIILPTEVVNMRVDEVL